jgi:hypothetical protein
MLHRHFPRKTFAEWLLALLLLTVPCRAWAGTGEQGSKCMITDECVTGLLCQQGYCCNGPCGQGSRYCEACNAEDIWQIGKNGTCTVASIGKQSPDICGPYQCAGGGRPECSTHCNDDPDCKRDFYCNHGSCDAKLGAGKACGGSNECSSGACQREDGMAGDPNGAPAVCCNEACTGECRGCVESLTGVASGTCANVKSESMGGTKRCATEMPLVCGHDGFCDGKGNCSFVPMGTKVGTATCTVDDAGRGSFCTMQTCDGMGVPMCTAQPCPYGCENGRCIEPPDAGVDGNSLVPPDSGRDVSVDVGSDAGSVDASCANGGCGVDAGCPMGANEAGLCFCRAQRDCPGSLLCRLDGVCRAGKPGEPCWPPGSETSEQQSIFDDKGDCKPGHPIDGTEIVGRCSMGTRGGASRWGGLLAALGALALRRSRRPRPNGA